MKSSLSQAQDWRRAFWIILLIVASFAFTRAFACAAPFAAFATAAALTLSRRDGVLLMLGAWLVNQLTGFLSMGYPQDANAFEWGAALGAIALISLFAARFAAKQLSNSSPMLSGALAFIAAFVVYEAGCYISALMLGGVENYTLAIQSWIFALNAGAAVGLFALNRLGTSLQIVPAYNKRMATF